MVVHPGPAGFARRSAIGEPVGAISVGGLSDAGGALIRMGEAPPALGSPVPPLPLWVQPPSSGRDRVLCGRIWTQMGPCSSFSIGLRGGRELFVLISADCALGAISVQ